ncbi:iditol 2-dehydrogenase [Candidimonas sp. SYP-B2681]|uniref:zinc-dependent alcohol dehydrogenase family protein n=1 Tax=Candidimonas sp. SYP-B2681 TaxID=2497686 RepID=UPI000F8619CF|nr:zinc-binding dehydrogenase [Candidimonas sp. SYP-B2681]RTZ45474.1 iditol 2-dehydrogenase [Candidimonas sp. SYP-B2681]
MLALTFPGDRQTEFVDFPDPTPGPGEVVIEMKASGLCGSDLHYYRRPQGTPMSGKHQYQSGPVIAGHEPSGIIAAIGAGVPESLGRIGDRVMVHHYSGCATCNHCRVGWQQLCQEVPSRTYGNNDHGSHAPYFKVPAMTLVPLPDELSFAAGAAISCGTGTAYGALRRLGLLGTETIAIFGQGPVGLAGTQLAKAMGARVIALDISADRLARAAAFGADHVINPLEEDEIDIIKQLTHGHGADVSLDSSGSSQGRIAAIRCLRTWGKTCFVGEGGDVKIDVSSDLLRRQATVMGSWTFSTVIQSECARFIADRKVDVDAVFTDYWRLDQAEEAYKLFDTQTTGKAVFLL